MKYYMRYLVRGNTSSIRRIKPSVSNELHIQKNTGVSHNVF
jgi:hypothetical protein